VYRTARRFGTSTRHLPALPVLRFSLDVEVTWRVPASIPPAGGPHR